MNLSMLYGLTYVLEMLISVWYFEYNYKSNKHFFQKLIFYISGYSLMWAASFLEKLYINTSTFIVFNMLILITIYGAGMFVAFFETLIMTGTMTLTELAGAGMLGILSSDFDLTDEYFNPIFWLMMLSKPLYFLGLILISHIKGSLRKEKINPDRIMLILTLIPVSSFVIMDILIEIAVWVQLSDSTEKLMMLCAVLLLFINVVTYWIYIISRKDNKQLITSSIALQREYDRNEMYRQELERYENQRILIHDIRNHLGMLDELLENKDIAGAREYIETINKSDELRVTYRYCDNSTLNLILSRYANLYSKNKIDYRFDVTREKIGDMDKMDMTALFCNILDNAYDAVVSYDGYREINLSIKDEMIVLRNSSSYREGNIEDIVSTKDGEYHGYGLKSVKKVVEKYAGTVHTVYDTEEELFKTIITLSIK